jgi:hypothetical protein
LNVYVFVTNPLSQATFLRFWFGITTGVVRGVKLKWKTSWRKRRTCSQVKLPGLRLSRESIPTLIFKFPYLYHDILFIKKFFNFQVGVPKAMARGWNTMTKGGAENMRNLFPGENCWGTLLWIQLESEGHSIYSRDCFLASPSSSACRCRTTRDCRAIQVRIMCPRGRALCSVLVQSGLLRHDKTLDCGITHSTGDCCSHVLRISDVALISCGCITTDLFHRLGNRSRQQLFGCRAPQCLRDGTGVRMLRGRGVGPSLPLTLT